MAVSIRSPFARSAFFLRIGSVLSSEKKMYQFLFSSKLFF